MKVSASTRTVIAIGAVVALAIAFWMLFLAPQRQKSDKLSAQTETLQAKLVESQSAVATGEESRRSFPDNYQQLVVLGKAVPAGDESASLLVQLNHVADSSHVRFQSLALGASDSSEAEAPPPPAPEEAAPEESGGESEESEGESSEEAAPEEATGVPAAATATESTAASLPMGASVGAAGLYTLPYDLTFTGSFFHVADFINGIDSLIHTGGSDVAVDGRLVTLNGFVLTPSTLGFPQLESNFSVTTYLVPSNQGITAGATPTEPGEAESSSTTVSDLR